MSNDDVCPVMSGYINKLRSLIDISRWIYDSERSRMQAIEELMDSMRAGTIERQHQRAFFCVEVIAFRFVLPDLARFTEPWRGGLLGWPRSREGLNSLLQTAREAHDLLVSLAMESTLAGTSRKGAAQLQEDRDARTLAVIDQLVEAAKTVRAAMKNSRISLSTVGGTLAVVAADLSPIGTVSSAIHIAHQLLDQTEQKAHRAWELPKS